MSQKFLALRLKLLAVTLIVTTLLPTDIVRAAGRTCPAPKLASQHDVERYIVASEEAWAKSVATNDASVVNRILAEDFVWVLDGKLLGKKGAVEAAADGPGPFLSNEPDYVHVRFFGDTAVAQGSETWAKKGGRRGKFVWTDTWVKRRACWQIVNAQDTVVQLPAK
ncbi:MAG: nuclear transport factor 2 family protein [Sphingomicrobium sp.]